MGQRRIDGQDTAMLAEAGLCGFDPARLDAASAERLLTLAGGRRAR